MSRTWMADWKLLPTYINGKEWKTYLEEDEENQQNLEEDGKI